MGSPDDSGAAPVGISSCIIDDVAREAHAYVLAPGPSARDVYAAKLAKMPTTPRNNGVTSRIEARDGRLTMTEIIDNAIPAYPRRIRKVG